MQETAFGEVETTLYASVFRKKTGNLEYFKVVNGVHIPITEEEYKLNNPQ